MSLLGNILLSAVAGIVESANKEPSPEEIKREQALREFEKGVPFYKLPEHDEDAVQTVITQCELWADNLMVG